MAYNEKLADRVREALMDVLNLTEKMMFRGVSFLVNDKMCVSVANDELLCRIGQQAVEQYCEMDGCRQTVMRGKVMKDFVWISEEGWQNQKDFQLWIHLSLAFNSQAKASPKKKKKANE